MTFPSHRFDRHALHSDDATPFDRAEIEGDLATRFEKQVDRYPDHLAFEDDAGNRLTYAELDAAANRVALHLLSQAVSMAGVPVGVYCGHSPQQIVALLGVLKTGGVVVGLDPTHPHDRSLELITLSQSAFVLTDPANQTACAAFANDSRPVLNVDDLTASGPDLRPHVKMSPGDNSHLFFTSGSTGQPKGIRHSHRALLHEMYHMGQVNGLGPSDRSAHVSPLTFAATAFKLYAALLFGGTVVPYDVKRRGLNALGAWLRDMQLTILLSNANALRQVCANLSEGYSAPSMRVIQIGGNVIRGPDLALHHRWFPDCTLNLVYGTSEALHVTLAALNPPHEEVTISTVPCGYPYGDHEVLLLGEDGRPVAAGEIGEFAVRSRYLASGYFQQPDLTAQVFRDDPDDAEYHTFMTGDLGRKNEDDLYFHMGRKDSQLKIRGYRVEPGEVESALLRIDGIQEAVAVGHQTRRGDTELVAYLVTDEGAQHAVDELRRILSQSLPDYLIPSHFMFLDDLPLTTTVKLNRRKLPPLRHERPPLTEPYAPPRTPLEERVAAVWADVLELDQVGIHDPFFDLGGHSLLATELIASVSETFALDVSFESLFDAPTVASMTDLIRRIAARDNPVIQAIDALPRDEYQKQVDQHGRIEDESP